jgi:hypothetical protein
LPRRHVALAQATNTRRNTVTGGTVRSVFHQSSDAAGGGHVTGTISPIGVTLIDGTSNTVYRLAGASWFGGNFDAAGNFVTTDTSFFNILGPSGGPVAKVAVVEHSSSGGANRSFIGQCSAPSD